MTAAADRVSRMRAGEDETAHRLRVSSRGDGGAPLTLAAGLLASTGGLLALAGALIDEPTLASLAPSPSFASAASLALLGGALLDRVRPPPARWSMACEVLIAAIAAAALVGVELGLPDAAAFALLLGAAALVATRPYAARIVAGSLIIAIAIGGALAALAGLAFGLATSAAITLAFAMLAIAQRAHVVTSRAGDEASESALPVLTLMVVFAGPIVAALAASLGRAPAGLLLPAGAFTGTALVLLAAVLLGRREAAHRRELARAREALRRSEAMRHKLVSVVSHELRAPLNSALTWINLLELDSSAANVRRAIGVVKQSVRRQSLLIDDLVEAMRGGGELHLDDSPTALDRVLDEALDELRTSADRELDVERDIAAGSYPVKANATRLRHAVRNLLASAARCTPPGGRIRVRLAREGADARLDVRDGGPGTPAEELPHVFDPLSAVGNRTLGIGFGLAVVESVVKRHGGRVSAESTPPDGTTLTIFLPLHESPASG